MKKLKWIGIVLFVLLGMVCGYLATLEDWIEPVEGVSLELPFPILKPEDITEKHAFHYLTNACAALEGVEMPGEWNETEDDPWAMESHSNMVAVLDAATNAFALARQATAFESYQSPTITNINYVMPYISQVRKMNYLLKTSSFRNAAEGKYDQAYDDLFTGMKFSRIQSRGGAMINWLVDLACIKISTHAMRHIADRYELSEELMDEAVDQLGDIEKSMISPADVYRYEYCFTAVHIESLFSNKKEFRMAYGIGDEAAVLLSSVGFIMGSNENTVKRNFRSLYQNVIYSFENPGAPSDWNQKLDIDVKSLIRARDPVGLMLAHNWSLGNYPNFDGYYKAVVELRATRLFLAVKMYEKLYGRLPVNPDDLVPEFLDKWPKDPQSGKDLNYDVLGEKHFQIHGEGTDIEYIEGGE